MKGKPSNQRRELTPEEREAIGLLQCVRYPSCSWDKRFARAMGAVETISDKEAPQVWRLLKRYRRQIVSPNKAKLLAVADCLAAPDFRQQQAMYRDQARLAKYKEENQ